MRFQRYEPIAGLDLSMERAAMVADALVMAQSVAREMANIASERNSDLLFKQMQKRWEEYEETINDLKRLEWVAEARPEEAS